MMTLIPDVAPGILLHACCGPCSTAALERLVMDGWRPTVWFGNSNIYPLSEADKRYRELCRVAEFYNLPVIRGEWNHAAWRQAIAGHEDAPEHGERCSLCFAYNLRETWKKASELGFSRFTTTLTVSRFKKSATIFSVGEQFEGFEKIDFKKKDGFARSVTLSKELGLYRQDYCGCEFSLRDSIINRATSSCARCSERTDCATFID
ncbi:epoxyqueuosine reductase QueH [Parasphaerochaeta coccoides]|uniref:Epoxyqueuosine reductase QueH n=1 Tax=Parasphaerochaeta coccoides (strain ATCC BAA-1237 / DSM 17374 / SPN1) TaxID=760011 RepID=F4GH53_PARC1|nr:epoxyqueuosine reductase QueH [Parasphaerochaeta coccoides]AEC01528.1 protein of unknown function DUF208 [Parasphaerochaeta coccoides DSM 17374]